MTQNDGNAEASQVLPLQRVEPIKAGQSALSLHLQKMREAKASPAPNPVK